MRRQSKVGMAGLERSGMFRLTWILALAPVLSASQITVTSYSATAGTTNGSFTYLDSTGSELTDGNYGVIPFASQAQADPWIGWYQVNPLITFNFGGPVDITQVDLDLALWTDPALISLPTSIDIGGTVFDLTGNELTNPSRGTLSFNVNFTGISSLDVTLQNGGVYVFMDEAQFFSTQGGSEVPEPATWSPMLAGLLALIWKARAPKRASQNV
jgi:hypothetical protein